MPTVQGTDDFDHAIDAGFYTDGFFGSPEAVGTPLYASQPATLRIETAGGAEGVRHNLSGAPTLAWAAFPFRTPALAATSFSVANFGTPVGSIGQIICGSTGLALANSSNNGPEVAISEDVFHWVEMIFDVSGVNHQIYGRIDGVDMTSPTAHAAGASTDVEFHQLLNFGDTGEIGLYGWWQWGVAASITDWLGEPAAALGRIYKRLYGPAQLGSSAATLYTVPAGTRTEIRQIFANNPSGSPVDVTLSIGTDSASTRFVEETIPAGEALNLRRKGNRTLTEGEVIQGFAGSAATVVLTINGVEEA